MTPEQKPPLREIKKDLLRQQGVPEPFLEQLTDIGIQADYYNTFVAAITVVHSLSFPQEYPPNFVASSRSKLKPNLRKIQTYSEYWRDQIEKYNKPPQAKGRKPIDGDRVFRALVTDHERTQELDGIALAIRQLAHTEDPEETIMPHVIRYVAEAQGIIFGDDKKKKVLASFGLQEQE